MEKFTAVLLSCVGLFFVISLGDACNCNINHPQQLYCQANFTFVGTIREMEEIDYQGKSFLEYSVEITRSSIYKGRRFLSGNRNSQPVLTPYSGSLCGKSNLVRNKEYLLTGSVENGALMIDFCNWIVEWKQVSKQQKKYLRDGVYDENCNQCNVTGTARRRKFDQNLHTDFVNELQVSGLWTQRDCYYNPLASHYYRSKDCETDLSYCSFDREAGRCLWKWTDDYSECFDDRETLWQVYNGAQPAFTHRRQCREITLPILKAKCKRAIVRQKKLERQLRRQALRDEVNGRDTVNELGLDLDLDY